LRQVRAGLLFRALQEHVVEPARTWRAKTDARASSATASTRATARVMRCCSARRGLDPLDANSDVRAYGLERDAPHLAEPHG
jgi:hypothetical protein